MALTSRLRRIVKPLFPSRWRRFLRAVQRDLVFRRAMKRFLKSPETPREFDDPVLLDLVYGWGNESWCGRGEFLADCINQAITSRGAILECGSGLSTILVGAIAKKRKQKPFALEHLPQWADRVQKCLDRYHVNSVTLCSTPLIDYGGFHWYHTSRESLPGNFGLVICDGPPGGTMGGRYGLVPVMRGRLTPGCIILLDDALRDEELAVARRWEEEIDATVECLGERKPYIRVTVTGRAGRQLQQPA
ncbi:MAG: class I SAM-dependent methyltransferase [Gemmatimonadetes bacterium]|nr:class I SAM-dependent methyltransferase [Gemmatimonadota bacterium]